MASEPASSHYPEASPESVHATNPINSRRGERGPILGLLQPSGAWRPGTDNNGQVNTFAPFTATHHTPSGKKVKNILDPGLEQPGGQRIVFTSVKANVFSLF